jgi:hypothetical protein
MRRCFGTICPAKRHAAKWAMSCRRRSLAVNCLMICWSTANRTLDLPRRASCVSNLAQKLNQGSARLEPRGYQKETLIRMSGQ